VFAAVPASAPEPASPPRQGTLLPSNHDEWPVVGPKRRGAFEAAQ